MAWEYDLAIHALPDPEPLLYVPDVALAHGSANHTLMIIGPTHLPPNYPTAFPLPSVASIPLMTAPAGRLSHLLSLAARACLEHAPARASTSAATGSAWRPHAHSACRAAAGSPAADTDRAFGQPWNTVAEMRRASPAFGFHGNPLQHLLRPGGSNVSGTRAAHSAVAPAVDHAYQQHRRGESGLDAFGSGLRSVPPEHVAVGSDPQGAAEPRRLLQAALVGAPNAGKSTLTNALVGQKVRGSRLSVMRSRHVVVARTA